MTIPVHRFRVTAGDADLSCARFGRGTRLVYLHALAYSKEHAVRAANVLGESFGCIAFDQRGHGDSRAISQALLPVDLIAMTEDVARVMDQCGWDSATVGGTSMGAAVALRFAARFPDRVRTLVQDLPAFGPRSPRDPDRAAWIAEALASGDLREAARRATSQLSDGRARALAATLLAQWQPFDPVELGPKVAAAFRGTATWTVLDEWPTALERIAVPVHILALPGDASHPFEVAETMAKHLPNVKLHRRVPTLDPRLSFAQWTTILGH